MAEMISAYLEGGPEGLPAELRVRSVIATTDKIKVEYNGGHEHFNRGDGRSDHSGSEVTFYWTTRTRIAE